MIESFMHFTPESTVSSTTNKRSRDGGRKGAVSDVDNDKPLILNEVCVMLLIYVFQFIAATFCKYVIQNHVRVHSEEECAEHETNFSVIGSSGDFDHGKEGKDDSWDLFGGALTMDSRPCVQQWMFRQDHKTDQQHEKDLHCAWQGQKHFMSCAIAPGTRASTSASSSAPAVEAMVSAPRVNGVVLLSSNHQSRGDLFFEDFK